MGLETLGVIKMKSNVQAAVIVAMLNQKHTESHGKGEFGITRPQGCAQLPSQVYDTMVMWRYRLAVTGILCPQASNFIATYVL